MWPVRAIFESSKATNFLSKISPNFGDSLGYFCQTLILSIPTSGHTEAIPPVFGCEGSAHTIPAPKFRILNDVVVVDDVVDCSSNEFLQNGNERFSNSSERASEWVCLCVKGRKGHEYERTFSFSFCLRSEYEIIPPPATTTSTTTVLPCVEIIFSLGWKLFFSLSIF